MKKVLLLNEWKTNNYGDIAINKVITKILKKSNIGVYNYLFWKEEISFGKNYTKYPKLIRFFLWKCQLAMDFGNYLYAKKILKSNNFDYIVIGGGELLGYNFGFNSAMYIWAKLAKRKNIPMLIYGVSGSDDLPKNKSIRYQKALSSCKYIVVRDKYTYDLVKKNFPLTCKYAPDCVFAYKKIFETSYKKEKKEKMMLMAPILYYDDLKKGLGMESEEQYLQYLVDIIKNHLLNYSKIIITVTDKSDELISRKLFSYLKNDDEFLKIKIIYKSYDSLETFISLLEKCDLVVSGRMHAMILGKIYGCKIEPIAFKIKLKVFKKEYQNITAIETVEQEALESLIKLANYINNN